MYEGTKSNYISSCFVHRKVYKNNHNNEIKITKPEKWTCCFVAWLSYCLIIISSSSSSLFYTIPSSLSLKYIKIVEIISFKFSETHNTTQETLYLYIQLFNFNVYLSIKGFSFGFFAFRESLLFELGSSFVLILFYLLCWE